MSSTLEHRKIKILVLKKIRRPKITSCGDHGAKRHQGFTCTHRMPTVTAIFSTALATFENAAGIASTCSNWCKESNRDSRIVSKQFSKTESWHAAAGWDTATQLSRR